MEPSTVAAGSGRAKPAAWWILITIAAGGAGSMGAIAAAGSGTYEVAPFQVELRALPAPAGKTVLAKRPAGIEPGRAEAGTHNAPLELRATITGVSVGSLTSTDRSAVATPEDMADFMGDEGKNAVRSFVIKLGLLSVGGGAAAGLGVSFGHWRRIAGGAVAGLLTMAVIGVLVQQTYQTERFGQTRFRSDVPAVVDGLPTDLPGG